MTDEVEELLRVLGPFYELIEEKKKILHVSDLSTGEVLSLPALPVSACFLFVMSHNIQRLTISFFFFGNNLPLVQHLARLTMFAKQLEGKYITV